MNGQTVRSNKILVVDDEVSLVQACQVVLREAGHDVRGAVNGRQALRMITEEMPDIVLLDVRMPGMSGIEVCRAIRHNDHPRQPCILMYTTDNREEVRVNSLAAGANDFITKQNPFFDLPAKIAPYLTGSVHPIG